MVDFQKILMLETLSASPHVSKTAEIMRYFLVWVLQELKNHHVVLDSLGSFSILHSERGSKG